MSEETQGSVDLEIPEEIGDLNEIPQSLQRFYHESEGVYKLRDFDAVERAKENASAAEKLAKKEALDLKKRLAAMEKYEGIDLEEYQKLKEAQMKAEEEKAKEEGNWEKLRAAMQEAHAKELEAVNSKATQLQSSLEEYMVDSQLTNALAAAGATEAGMRLLPLELRRNIQLANNEGRYTPNVLDADGTPRVKADGSLWQISDQVAEAKELFPDLFRGTAASGSGTPAETASSGAKASSDNKSQLPDRSKMTELEIANWIAAYGFENYQAWVNGKLTKLPEPKRPELV